MQNASGATSSSPEDVVANVLRVLSTSTSISPLFCRCEVRESMEDDGNVSRTQFSWDPFVSFSKDTMSKNDDDDVRRVVPVPHSQFLYNWLNGFLPTLNYHQHCNMKEIRNSFVDTNRMNKLLKRKNKPTDGELWQAGLQLLMTHLYPNNDTRDMNNQDDTTTWGEGDDTNNNMDPIPPHVLLQTVMDSYYGNDTDLDLGHLSGMDEVLPVKLVKMYYLPTSVGMFFLRTFLMARALESANEAICVSRAKSQPIRWKRLKSMVDDAHALFRLMTFDYAGKAIDEYVHGRVPRRVDLFQPDPLQLIPNALLFYPVEPTHVVSVATWSYTNLVLPWSHALLGELLKNETFGVGTQYQYRGKILESCYDTFSMLTTLLALDVAGVVQDYATPSCCVRWALQFIESKNTGKFFDLVKSETARYNFKSNGVDSGDREGRMYLPWIVNRDDFRGRGMSLCDDLLLAPTIRKMIEETDEVSDTTFYDELGIAYIAYWKLMAQAKAMSDSVDPLPSPYSGTHRWVLLMPHVMTFLMWIKSSSTMARMEELELLSRTENTYLIGICGKLSAFGFDFVQTVLTTTTAVRPISSRCSESSNVVVRYGHSLRGLGMIHVALLSHVVRLSGYEPPAQAFLTRTYSSLDVMNMTRSLIHLHQPEMQIQIIATTCTFIENSDFKALIPRLIDFLRQIINNMCDNVELYGDSEIAIADMTVMQKISAFIDTSIDDACVIADNLHPSNAHEFISSSETYSAAFALMRLQQIWLDRTSGMALDGEMDDKRASNQLSVIDEWMNESLRKLESFYRKIHILITIWEKSDAPPENWHMLYLLQSTLNDVYDNNC